MRLKKHSTIALIISLVSLIGFSIMVLLIANQNVILFDHNVISFIQGFEGPSLTSIMKFFTYIGSYHSMIVIILIIVIFLYIVLKHRLEIILLLTVVITTPILNGLLKQSFQRARPEFHRLIDIGGYSFPSGHAMNAFAFYGILTFLLWRHIPNPAGRTILIVFNGLFIMMIGISRIYLGVHYPSDIIAGYCVSGFWLTIVIWSFQKYRDRLGTKKQSGRRGK
ncbi:phosphatase PAP2 family protein [Oceanobacillus chungangensis]|uniref:Phosphatase PAP2 family protein n=1 Tax=Oceanobacillus chungangensis TaxID=1229152 RepID=A0A3D8PYX1_9BACI|nr:phosphatase PAP2 family protein [Oceanobacillus chungangensis]RDW20498.1 phosphatase PAP2 family protein [Oceanobacillus chungangensis]